MRLETKMDAGLEFIAALLRDAPQLRREDRAEVLQFRPLIQHFSCRAVTPSGQDEETVELFSELIENAKFAAGSAGW